jgi:hypothetical protein
MVGGPLKVRKGECGRGKYTPELAEKQHLEGQEGIEQPI